VSVVILQQWSLLPTWWAAAEEKCSIGLAGRFVFSFAAAGEPGPPTTAQFGQQVALPLLKRVFRIVLRTLGPHSPLPTDSPLLNWNADAEGLQAVYEFRLKCSDLTKTLDMDETFASCVNKSGYWLTTIAFWTSVLSQVWPCAAAGRDDAVLHAHIQRDSLKLAMEFFTSRFLQGAAVLSADVRGRTWVRKQPPCIAKADQRWNLAALLLLKSSCGVSITAAVAQRAGPMFRGLAASPGTSTRAAAEAAYVEALEYLRVRGFGVLKPAPDGNLPVFLKRHYQWLPHSSKDQLAQARVPGTVFGLHVSGASCARSGADSDGDDGNATSVESESGNAKPASRQAEQAAGGEPSVVARQARGKASAVQVSTKVAKPQAKEEEKEEAWKAPVADSAAETKLPWEVLFDGEPRKAVENYTCLRSEVEQVVGARTDPGIYTFVDLGVEGPTRRLKAACKPEACKGCTRQLRASFRFGDAGPRLQVRARGKHGTLQKPSGGSLWTVAEEHMLANKIDEGARVTAKMVRAVFKQANMPLRCTDAQLHAWVSRTRKKMSALPPKPKKFLAAEMYAAASPFIADIAQWRTQPLHKLIVLPSPVFQEDRVCAIWTCPGMLSRAEAARNKVVKLAVDGKQKILCNNYSVLTLSFLVSSEYVTQTRDSRARVSSRPKVHTLTQEPFMQALVNSETEENVAQFFTAACEIAAQCCSLDLKTQVWQVHKDYAKGIEAARRKVFPSARPCDDYPHMRRASYSVLKQKMGLTRVYGPQFFCVGARQPPPHVKSGTKRLLSACASSCLPTWCNEGRAKKNDVVGPGSFRCLFSRRMEWEIVNSAASCQTCAKAERSQERQHGDSV